MKTLSLLLILVIGISLVCLPSHATNANTARVQQLLDQSTASFKQNNYMLGVSQVRQACTLLKQDPAANDGTCTYTDLAAQCINGVKQSIENMHPSNDFAGMAAVTARGSAIQPLLQACMQWEPTNPRWHYESGMIYRLESAALADHYPTMLMQAKGEFQKGNAFSVRLAISVIPG